MEWTGQQQIECLLQSFLLGVVQGILLDVISSFPAGIGKKHRWWIDAFFGLIAAVFTFCGALVITDGQLHPILMVSVPFGIVTAHITIGAFMRQCMRKTRIFIKEMPGVLASFIRFVMRIFVKSGRVSEKEGRNT